MLWGRGKGIPRRTLRTRGPFFHLEEHDTEVKVAIQNQKGRKINE